MTDLYAPNSLIDVFLVSDSVGKCIPWCIFGLRWALSEMSIFEGGSRFYLGVLLSDLSENSMSNFDFSLNFLFFLSFFDFSSRNSQFPLF